MIPGPGNEPSMPVSSPNEKIGQLPVPIAELAADESAAHVLFGCFVTEPRYGQHIKGHTVIETLRGGLNNISEEISRGISRETIYAKLEQSQLKEGMNEFEAFIVHWSDGQKGVLSLIYPDWQGDKRLSSHTDYHIIGSSEKIESVIPILKSDPSLMIELFHNVFPDADRSAGELAVKEFVELGKVV